MPPLGLRALLFVIGSILTAVGSYLTATFDNDPATQPNWALIGTALTAGLGILYAKCRKSSAPEDTAADSGESPPSP